MKGAGQCRQELQTLNEKLEGAKVMWTKDRRALEALVRQGWDNQTLLQGQIDEYKETLRQLNVSLDDCRQENVSMVTESAPPALNAFLRGSPVDGCLDLPEFYFPLNGSVCVCLCQ